MNRIDFIALSVLFCLLAFVPFVSAQYYGGGFWYGTEQVVDSIVFNLEPLLRALLGGYDWTGYLLFEKTLLFILISIISGLVLSKIPVFADRKKGVLRFVAVIIGILGVRNLNYIWINTIIVQYQVLFIAIAGILPFLIYWAFTKDLVPMMKKVAWIFYAVIYFGLWATTDLEAYTEVYFWGAVSALIYAFLIDTWLMQWMETQKMKKQFSRQTWNQIAKINDRIHELNEQIARNTHPNLTEAHREMRELERHRNSLARNRNTF